MIYDSRNLIYKVICPIYQREFIGKTGIGNSKLRDIVRIYMQHIQQPEHEKLKIEQNPKTCSKGTFTIFLFSQLHPNDTDLHQEYEGYFTKKNRTKLNNLYREKSSSNKIIK